MPKPKNIVTGITAIKGFSVFLVVCLSFIASFLLAEAVTRLYLYANRDILPDACRQDNKLLHHSLIPNSHCRFKTKEWDVDFRVNNLGMRDINYSPQKPPGTYRILLLGDSFAEGYGVEESQTYQATLEKKLNAQYSQTIEILNAGVQGYSPHLEYLYFLHQGLSLNPDLVILNLDLTDFSDDYRYQQSLLPPPLFQDTIPNVTWLPIISTQIKWWLHQHSRFYDLAIKTAKKYLYPQIFKDQIGFTPLAPQTDTFIILRDLNEKTYQDLWRQPTEYILKIKTLLDEKSIPLVVMMHPHGHQLSPVAWNQGRHQWAFESGKIYSLRPQQDLHQFATSQQIAYLDLLPAFKGASDPKSLFFDFDGHFTPAGHQLMADTLFTFLPPYFASLPGHRAPR